MRKILWTVFSVLFVLSVTGCMQGAAATANAAEISSIPQDAELQLSYTSEGVYGAGVTTDIWRNAEDTGFFVVEFRCDSGGIQRAMLQNAAGEPIAWFGSIREDGVLITDLVVEAAGDYSLYFGKSDYFHGEINVYFVAGIGYSTVD